MVGEKGKEWKRCNFFGRVRRLGSKFCFSSDFTRKVKVIQLFKAKMEALRDKNPKSEK